METSLSRIVVVSRWKGENMSYKKLVIWQEARQLVIDIHKMTLNKLPQFELYVEKEHRTN